MVIFWNLCRKINTYRGSDSNIIGAISKEAKKLENKLKNHGYPAQTHTTWWIRIS